MQYRFSDLIVLSDIQQLINSFVSCWGIPIQIWDFATQTILAASGKNFFDQFHQDTAASRRKDGSGDKALAQTDESSSRRFEELFEYARTIRIENRDLATLFLGPVFHTPPDEDKFRLLARESGLEEAAYLKAVRAVPILSDGQAETYVALLVQLIQRLAEQGLNEIRLMEAVAEVQERQQAYRNLEKRIQESTEELERTNAALQEGEQRFRVALVDTPVTVFNQDLDLRYTWIYNPRNYADQPVVGKTDAELFSAEDAMRLIALKKRVIAAGLLTREAVSMTVGGRTLFYDMTLDPLYDANGVVTGLTCAAMDITERKQIEDALRQTNVELVRTQKRIEQILHALQAASGSLEPDSVLENILSVLITAVEADIGSIYLIDKEQEKLIPKVIKGTPITSQEIEQGDPATVLPPDSFLARAFTSGKTLVYGSAGQEPGLNPAMVQRLGIKSLLAVPLIVAERVLGVAVLCKIKNQQFDQEEVELVQGIANSVALAVENARFYDEMRRRLAESEGIQRIAKGLLQKIGLDEVLEIVCTEAMQLTGAKGSAVLLLGKDGWLRLTHHAGSPAYNLDHLPVDGSFAGQAVKTGSLVWVTRQESDLREAADQWKGFPWTPGLHSMLSVPLKVDTQTIGVLNILNKPGELTQEDIRILDLFADQAAIIIEHVRLQHQTEQFAVLEERQRLARELHDSVTQALYSMTLYADAARLALSAKQWQALETNLGEVHNMAREAMYDMRLLVFELRPFLLEKEGLVSALRARLAAVEGRAGLKTSVFVENERRLPITVEEEIYRIAQEGLNNVVKHAQAREVQIHLGYGQDRVVLEMTDDGLGFDPQAADQSGGVGLRGIRERVQQLNGSLEIESASRRGTRLKVIIPIGEGELHEPGRHLGGRHGQKSN